MGGGGFGRVKPALHSRLTNCDMHPQKVSLFWFRRDLRLDYNFRAENYEAVAARIFN